MTRLHAHCLAFVSLWSCAALLINPTPVHGATSHSTVERWDLFEITLTGSTSGNPYLDVQVSAIFSQGDRHVTVPGFWDGGDTYKIRFSPPTTGPWHYETKSAVPELNGKTGKLMVTASTGSNHGPVCVFDTYYFRYADGTPYHEYGTTCYAWVHQTEALQEQTLKTLAASPFNKIRFCVFPKSYAYNKNEPEYFAFKRGADGTFDFGRPDPVFWHHFEQRILDLQRLGIQADLILWHPYDRWGFKTMSDDQDDRYLRYCIARLSAFRNVWWSLANEYDFMSNINGRDRGNKTMEDWDRFFSILQREDPHQRLRGIHNGHIWYDHTKDWVTHASLQTSDMNGGVRFREKYHKPIVYDECRYEGNIPQGWGHLTGREMTQRFWLGTMSGCYVGHGETFKDPHDILWWSKGGVLHGESPKRIQWLKDFMAKAPPFHQLQPLGDDKGHFILAIPGQYYLLYCLGGSSQSIQLAGKTPYKVDAIDPWEMTITSVGTAQPGEFKTVAPKDDVVYRFVPYAAGEKLRPEARITASASEGLPPLKVAFASTADGHAHWDFGDGSTSRETHPTHVFQKPGLYTVKLTITDADGASAEAFQTVAVEQEVTAPLVHVGLPVGQDRPQVTLEGTARRGSGGSFHLPDDEPWGWVQVGAGPLDDLRGLRSFTVMGWLKPESLEVGSGGNRILFCLKGGRSGIDLVCHSDGRLRLSVNEWPDSVNNDSSPGKLKLGKWTFFAVSYNSIMSEDNVSWYFSPPLNAPGPTAIRLDQRTSYNVGPLDSEIGPLTIGNFNETMRSYGLDRQFRGEIRDVQLFGSPVGGRGALGINEIVKHSQSSPSATHGPKRPRVIITSDYPPVDVIPGGAGYGPAEKRSDPDDVQSMVRFLLYTDEFDVEGLIASAGTKAYIARKQNILDMLNLYDQVDETLRLHDPRYPTAEQLRSVTWQGRDKTYGRPAEEILGNGMDSEASDAIIKVVDRRDPQPVWVCVWGGPREVAQAIWKVRETRSPVELEHFLSKLRIYLIGKQDGSAQWLLDQFPNLFIILADKTYRGMIWDASGSDTSLADLNWIDTNIRKGHGPLCAAYPESGWDPASPGQKEGDSPSFLHLVSAVRGLNDPEQPDQGGWGGQFVRPDSTRNHWFDGPGPQSVFKWRAQVQEDFARRADWCVSQP